MKYLLFIAGLVFVANIHAEVYKWVDEDGTVHYGDKPAEGSEEIKVQEYKTQDAPADFNNGEELSREEKRQRISDALEEDRLAKKEEREKKRKEREKRRKECNYLRDKQRGFASAGYLYKLDRDGNRIHMSNTQREQAENNLNKRIQKACR